jgi:hypothetical protein
VASVPTEVIEGQVRMLLAKAKPDAMSAARIRAALARPVVGPDRLAIARIDATLRRLGQELVSDDAQVRDVLERIEDAKAERRRLLETPLEREPIDPSEATDWLASLGALWDDTSPEGKRRLALSLFDRLGAVAGRIVEVEPTQQAAARGLTIALPTHLESAGVGGAGPPAPRVMWRVRIIGRNAWLRLVRSA